MPAAPDPAAAFLCLVVNDTLKIGLPARFVSMLAANAPGEPSPR